MANFISNTTAHISNVLKGLQVKRFLAVVLVGFLVMTTNVAPQNNSKALTNKIDDIVHQNDSQRPKTTGEWNKEARETEDAPGERLQRIGKQSAEAVKDFGTVYPDTAERSANADQ
ncbi:hypothetical protein NIES4071_35920 [Calothrix sp. NIES-4071]|nr:hypothetical protein NIES4071_35920 [Calothrix sp. NIES-4071]BAZ57911.1 hypothetical protein NIES4105_35850 [Calothrix sp. NIES-4105]